MRARVTLWAVAGAVAWVASNVAFPAPWGAFDMGVSGHGRLFWVAFAVLGGWNLVRHYRDPDRRSGAAPAAGPTVQVSPQATTTQPTVRVEASQ